jgi:hypothetical protein
VSIKIFIDENAGLVENIEKKNTERKMSKRQTSIGKIWNSNAIFFRHFPFGLFLFGIFLLDVFHQTRKHLTNFKMKQIIEELILKNFYNNGQ